MGSCPGREARRFTFKGCSQALPEDPLYPLPVEVGKALPVLVTALKLARLLSRDSCGLFKGLLFSDLSVALLPPFSFSCLSAGIMQVLWLLLVCPHLLVPWGFCGYLVT